MDHQMSYFSFDTEYSSKLNTTRKKFWNAIKTNLTSDAISRSRPVTLVNETKPSDTSQTVRDTIHEEYICYQELNQISKLAEGSTWFDFVPQEWIDIYTATYEAASSLQIDPGTKTKISKDIHRTFSLFSRTSSTSILNVAYRVKSAEYIASLETILCLASHSRGYTQGMNFLAAFFLLATGKDERKSYILLVYLLKHRCLDILYDSKCSCLLEYMKTFDKKLRRYNKRVYYTLKEKGFFNICYALEWFTTCFIVSAPKNIAPYVIDLLFADIPDILLRVGLSVMNLLQDYIINASNDELQMNFKKMVVTLDPLSVISQALLINLGQKSSILRVSLQIL